MTAAGSSGGSVSAGDEAEGSGRESSREGRKKRRPAKPKDKRRPHTDVANRPEAVREAIAGRGLCTAISSQMTSGAMSAQLTGEARVCVTRTDVTGSDLMPPPRDGSVPRSALSARSRSGSRGPSRGQTPLGHRFPRSGARSVSYHSSVVGSEEEDVEENPFPSSGGESPTESGTPNKRGKGLGFTGFRESRLTGGPATAPVPAPSPAPAPATPPTPMDVGRLGESTVSSPRAASPSPLVSLTSLDRPGRGRPRKEGEDRERIDAFLEGQEARRRDKSEERGARAVQDMLDPLVPAPKPSRGSKPLRPEGDIVEEVRGLTPMQSAAIIFQQMDVVDKGATCANKMKGDVVHQVREATHAARVVAEVMARAAGDPFTAFSSPAGGDEERARLYEQVRALREENSSLKGRLEELQELRAEVARLRQAVAETGGRVTRGSARGRVPMEASPEASPDRAGSGDDPTWRPESPRAWPALTPAPPPPPPHPPGTRGD